MPRYPLPKLVSASEWKGQVLELCASRPSAPSFPPRLPHYPAHLPVPPPPPAPSVPPPAHLLPARAHVPVAPAVPPPAHLLPGVASSSSAGGAVVAGGPGEVASSRRDVGMAAPSAVKSGGGGRRPLRSPVAPPKPPRGSAGMAVSSKARSPVGPADTALKNEPKPELAAEEASTPASSAAEEVSGQSLIAIAAVRMDRLSKHQVFPRQVCATWYCRGKPRRETLECNLRLLCLSHGTHFG